MFRFREMIAPRIIQGAALLAAFALAGCEEDKIRLSGSEIAQLFETDQKINFQSIRYAGWANVFADQTINITVIGLGEDQGEWWINGDTICSKWGEIRQGATLCAHVSRYVEGSYAVENISTGVRFAEIFFSE